MKLFTLVHKGKGVHLAAQKKVIAAEEFSQLVSASKLIEEGQEEVERAMQACKEECERLYEKAKEEGFVEGQGKWTDQLLHFDKEVKRLRHEAMQSILPLALKAAKKIVGEELKLYPERIVDIVLQTLQPISQNRRIVIYVSKSDKELLEAERPRIKEILAHVETLVIQERSDIAPGDCIIETEKGIINASLENQWRVLEAAFAKYM